jgi:hypothetical protein
MYRITIQNGIVVSKESLHHLESFEGIEGILIPDELIKNVRLPAIPQYDKDGNIIKITPLPEPDPQPEPPSLEDRISALEMALLELMGI